MLASVLLGSDPPRLPNALLVRTGALFGITEGTVRTALSRMAAAGEVVADDGGYRLTGRLVDRQRRQAASRRAEVRDWDGTWELATISSDDARPAADRAALRDALRALRLAELREGVWGRPDNLDPDRSPDARVVVDQWCTRWEGAAPSPPIEVMALWELRPWRAEAEDLRGAMAELVDRLEAGDASALADGFVVSAAVLRLFQHDPLLPGALLPEGWPGGPMRAEYDRYDAAYRATLRSWFASEAGTLPRTGG
ncbi:MAG: PaaX family transcriptional regulator C-terminal domain-containing protein [Acidimicrobiales bacterium]